MIKESLSFTFNFSLQIKIKKIMIFFILPRQEAIKVFCKRRAITKKLYSLNGGALPPTLLHYFLLPL